MRNLKKILALVLALVMSLSLMATAGAADFSDKDQISDKYSDAVTVLNGLEVFKGYDNGARFEPQGNITRAEVAAIIYRIATGDVTDTQKDIYSTWGLFTDVADGSWYAGYVNYCANAGYIKGRGNKIFDPNGKVTGYEALAMILRAIGYDKNNEFSGSNWQVNTASIAKQRGITNNITDTLLGQAATREVVAEILFQAILVPTVTFNTATISYTNNATSLGKDVLNLDKVTGVVVANEFANVQDDDLKVLAEGKTQLRVAAGDVRTLDLGTDLNDIGMSENAYIQGSKVLLISEAENTVFDNTDKNGENVDISSASKFSDKTGMSKNDSTEFFVNFDHSTRHEANRRIEVRVTFANQAAEETHFDSYTGTNISALAVENGYSVFVGGSNTSLPNPNKADYAEVGGYGYPVEYVKVFKVEDELTDDDLAVIKGIFGMADDVQGTTFGVSGSVYVGTNSQDVIGNWNYTGDKSNEMSYSAFKAEYINETVDKKWDKANDGEWVKIIDNNGDGAADYAFKTTFTLDKAVNTYTKNDESTLRYYALDLINGDYTGRYMNTVAEGDIVLHTVIDGQALIWKANTAEDEITKINDMYSRKVTATTKSGETYSQSEIDNATRLDQRIDQMSETVNYRMYLDAFGRIRAYEPVDGTKYALITELYYGNLQNGRYVKNDVLTAELKAGDAALTERVVNNPLSNDFLLNVRDFNNVNGINGVNNWSQLNNAMMALKAYIAPGETQSIAYDYVTNLYRNEGNLSLWNPLATGNWADYVILQPAISNLGFRTTPANPEEIFRNATTNIARYVVNADGTVNLGTAAQRSYNANGTLNSGFSVDYVELVETSVSAKQNVYNANVEAGFNPRVDANNETEYYIVTNSGVEHFVGYQNLPAISGIRSMYSVARNTSTDKDKLNYWVAEVVVIESTSYIAQPDDYVFVLGRADMIGGINTLSNSRMAVGSQYLYAISAKEGGDIRIAPTTLSWGVGTVGAGFYKAYGMAKQDDGTFTVDRLTPVEPAQVNNANNSVSSNTSNFKLRAGTVTKVAGMNDRFEVEIVGSGSHEQISFTGPVLAVIQDGRSYITLSTRLDGDNHSNLVPKERDIIWVDNGSGNALFTIDVTYSEKQSDKNSQMAALLRDIWEDVEESQGNVIKAGYEVSFAGVYSDNTFPTKNLIFTGENGVVLSTGENFRIPKDAKFFRFQVEGGWGVATDIDTANGKEIVVTGAKIRQVKITGDDTYYELYDIKGDVSLKVPVKKVDTTNAVPQLIVKSNSDQEIYAKEHWNSANITKVTNYITLSLVNPDGKMIEVVDVTCGNVDVKWTYNVETGNINFTESFTANDNIVVTVKVVDLEAHAKLRVPAVAPKGKETQSRNERLADNRVPLLMVNGYSNSWTIEGNEAVFDLGVFKPDTKLNLTLTVNPQADIRGITAVRIYLPGETKLTTMSISENAYMNVVFTVQDNKVVQNVEVEPITGANVDLTPTVYIGTEQITGNSYTVNKDTTPSSLRVYAVAEKFEAASVNVYAIAGDTNETMLVSRTGKGSVEVNVPVADLYATNSGVSTITVVVKVTYADQEVVKEYTITAGTNTPEGPGTGGSTNPEA